MILVGAGACNRVDDSAGLASELGAEVVRLNREFLQRVWIRQRTRRVRVEVVVLRAVQDVVRVVRPVAVHRHRIGARVRGARGYAGIRIVGYARDQAHQLCGVPAIQRKFRNALLIDHRLECRRRGVHD